MDDWQLFTRYVFTFTKTPDTLKAYNLACGVFTDPLIIPVPSQISTGCGLALLLKDVSENEALRFLDSLNFEAKVFTVNMYFDEEGINQIAKAAILAHNIKEE